MDNFWYVLKVLSGKEKELTEQLNQQIQLGRVKNIKRFICPIEKEYVTIKNKKVLREKIIYNGYVYFEAQQKLNEDELKDITMFPNVTSLFGNKTPLLMNRRDVDKILKDDALDVHVESKILKYNIGEYVTIKDGPFNNFEGKITKLSGDRIDLDVMIFGRPTNVSLTMEQIEKIK
jgi:transcriptional antiterminator NusG